MDEDKNLSNQRKHGLSYEVAARASLDPLQLSMQDRIEDGKQRRQTTGQIDGLAIVPVAHAFAEERSVDGPVDVIRIISAPPATRREGNRHDEG